MTKRSTKIKGRRSSTKRMFENDQDVLKALAPGGDALTVDDRALVAFLSDRDDLPSQREINEVLARHHPLLGRLVEVTEETYTVERGTRGILVDIGTLVDTETAEDLTEGVIAFDHGPLRGWRNEDHGSPEREHYGAPILPGMPPYRYHVRLSCLRAVTP